MLKLRALRIKPILLPFPFVYLLLESCLLIKTTTTTMYSIIWPHVLLEPRRVGWCLVSHMLYMLTYHFFFLFKTIFLHVYICMKKLEEYKHTHTHNLEFFHLEDYQQQKFNKFLFVWKISFRIHFHKYKTKPNKIKHNLRYIQKLPRILWLHGWSYSVHMHICYKDDHCCLSPGLKSPRCFWFCSSATFPEYLHN